MLLGILGTCRPRSACSQEHFTTIAYAKFGGQTECIMENWKIENGNDCQQKYSECNVVYSTSHQGILYHFATFDIYFSFRKSTVII